MRSSCSSLSCRPDLWFLVYEFLDPWCAEWMVWIVLLLMEYFSLWNRSINMLECEECVYILSLLLKSLSVLYIDFYMWIILKLIMVLTRSFLFFFFFSFLFLFSWYILLMTFWSPSNYNFILKRRKIMHLLNVILLPSTYIHWVKDNRWKTNFNEDNIRTILWMKFFQSFCRCRFFFSLSSFDRIFFEIEWRENEAERKKRAEQL